jgi:hypothetical protein
LVAFLMFSRNWWRGKFCWNFCKWIQI